MVLETEIDHHLPCRLQTIQLARGEGWEEKEETVQDEEGQGEKVGLA